MSLYAFMSVHDVDVIKLQLANNLNILFDPFHTVRLHLVSALAQKRIYIFFPSQLFPETAAPCKIISVGDDIVTVGGYSILHFFLTNSKRECELQYSVFKIFK